MFKRSVILLLIAGSLHAAGSFDPAKYISDQYGVMSDIKTTISVCEAFFKNEILNATELSETDYYDTVYYLDTKVKKYAKKHPKETAVLLYKLFLSGGSDASQDIVLNLAKIFFSHPVEYLDGFYELNGQKLPAYADRDYNVTFYLLSVSEVQYISEFLSKDIEKDIGRIKSALLKNRNEKNKKETDAIVSRYQAY